MENGFEARRPSQLADVERLESSASDYDVLDAEITDSFIDEINQSTPQSGNLG